MDLVFYRDRHELYYDLFGAAFHPFLLYFRGYIRRVGEVDARDRPAFG